jgi:SNF2 family DNA or RNA helicase
VSSSVDFFPVAPVKWPPLPYMKRAVKFLLEHACAALLLDPGLSKTAITLAALLLLKKAKLIRRVLIVAPLRVCHSTWPGELHKWLDFHGLSHVVLHGSKKEKLLQEDVDIYLINPEGLEWLLGVTKSKTPTGKVRIDVDYKRWKSFEFDTLVIDELTKFKHPSSQRFKALKLVHHTFGRRWGLTGSPVANGLEDLFGQFYMLDEGRSLGPYITHYRRQYFDPNPDGMTWRIRSGAETSIYERIAPISLRMSADEYLNLPPLLINKIEFNLSDDARRIYEAVEDDLVAKILDKRVVASNAAVASGKCRQLTGGGVYTTPDVLELVKAAKRKQREWIDVHSEKVDALRDLVDELQGNPLIVGYEFGHELERLRVAFPHATFVDDVSSSKFKQQIENPWNAGKIQLLIGQTSSIHLGLNLQDGGHHLCFFTTPWDYEVYDQLIRRLRRQGSTAVRITAHHLIAKATVDVLVMYALNRKERGQQALFAALQELAKSRSRKRG